MMYFLYKISELNEKYNWSLKTQIFISSIILSIVYVGLGIVLRLIGKMIINYSVFLGNIIIFISYLPIIFTIFTIGRWIGRYPITLKNHEIELHKRFQLKKNIKNWVN